MANATLYVGDAKETLQALPAESVQTCITSPPYWGLRDYGEDGQLGLEETPQEYVQNLMEVFREVRRVLRDDGTLWLNLGDSYAGGKIGRSDKHEDGGGLYDGTQDGWENQEPKQRTPPDGLKEKDLVGIPWRVALALQDDGWWLRSDIIWNKPNPMPESVTDRPTSSHEHIFLLTKSKQYYYDADAIREDAVKGNAGSKFHTGKTAGHHNGSDPSSAEREETGRRNKRDVWEVTTKPYSDAHFAVYPPDLIEPCVKAGTSKKGHCPECGAPWKRQVDHEPGDYEYSERGEKVGSNAQASGTQKKPAKRTTVGWEPGCNCDKDPEPDVVLDPFAGAGTTGLVALAKGRDFIGIDLSRDYCEMAAERIRSDAPLMNQVEICTPVTA